MQIATWTNADWLRNAGILKERYLINIQRKFGANGNNLHIVWACKILT